MHAYQDRAVTYLYEHSDPIAVVPMGGGKTVISYTAILELLNDGAIAHAWVFPPKRPAQLVWPKEAREWEHLDGAMRIVSLTGKEPGERNQLFERGLSDTPHVTIIHHDIFDWWWERMKEVPAGHPYWDLLVIDEISRFRNPKSSRVKALVEERMRYLQQFKNIWGLTGTPRPNGEMDLFKPAQIVTRGKLWGLSYYAWEKERFAYDRTGRLDEIKDRYRQQTWDEFSSIAFTVSDEDMPELPPLVEIPEYVDLPSDVMAEYKRMERLLFSRFDGKLFGDELYENEQQVTIAAANKGVATGKLAQIAQGFMYGPDGSIVHLHALKGDWIVDRVDSMAGAPLLIAYEFQEDLAVLRDLFGADLPYLGQGVSDKKAAQYERAWNERKLPILALHPFSAGHGLNLQRGGNHLACYGVTWSAEFYDQMVKRMHRQGQGSHCWVHLCLARGTVDEMKRDRVIGKMTSQQAFNAHLKRI